MRKLIYTFIISIFTISYLSAQIDSTQFIFGKFQNGEIFYKDGRVYHALVDYNLVVNCFLFVDNNDNNEIKRFGEVSQIACVKVGGRSFIQQSDGNAYEVLKPEPFIAVKYKGVFRAEGKQVGYGGRSETASVDSYSSLSTSGNLVNLSTEKYLLVSINKQYLIEVNKKRKTFNNEKQLLKIFPKHKEELAKYIEENNVKFNDIEEVLKMLDYAYSLK